MMPDQQLQGLGWHTEPQRYGFQPTQPDQRTSALDTLASILADPRNAWMGMGPGGVAMAAPKIGASAAKIGRMSVEKATRLYEAIEKHEGLTRFLKRMGVGAYDRMMARSLTDDIALGTESYHRDRAYMGLGLHDAMKARDFWGRAGEPTSPVRTAQTLGELNPLYGKSGIAPTVTESASQGNAAYGAVSRQVGRMLDEIKAGTRQFKFGETGPAPVSEAEYYKEIPIVSNKAADVTDRAFREALERLPNPRTDPRFREGR